MGDPSAVGFQRIINTPQEYDAAIEKSNQGKMVVIGIWSESNPVCRNAEPQVTKLASEFSQVEFFKMPLTGATQPLVKFGIQNTPIFILAQDEWATTVLGANMKMLEDAIRQKA